jgi:hypothetical protein
MNAIKNVATKAATTSNGIDVKTSTQPAAVTLPKIEPQPKEEKKDTNKKGLPTIEEQLAKLEELNTLAEKRELVKEALKNVSDFYIAPNGNCSLKFSDSNNRNFNINHPFVIEEIITLVTFKLEAELDRLETLIDFKF